VKPLELGASVTSEVMVGASSSSEWPGTGEGLRGGRQRRGLGESLSCNPRPLARHSSSAGDHLTTRDDRSLVSAFLADRDQAAFRALFQRHTPAMYLLVLRLLGRSGRHAEDVVQETWVRAASALGSFSWRSSLRTWLLGIAVNCSREVLRSASRDAASAGHHPEAGTPAADPGSPPCQGPERIDLERAIRKLPDGYREVFILHDVEGLTHEEIGNRLGIDAGTSKSQLSRARHALRAYWAGGKP
jgi:RNA polymerase sigma-70 factor (ECF subfamily)